MQAAFVTDYDDGLRIDVADETEQQILLARRQAQLGCWLNRPLPVFDSGHPYGHRYKFHGPHKQSFPRTFRDRALDSARVNRDLQGLTRSCWSPPPAWHGESARLDRAVRRAARRFGPAPPAFASAAPGGHELVCHLPTP